MFYLLVLIPLLAVLALNVPLKRAAANWLAPACGLTLCALQVVWALLPGWGAGAEALPALNEFFRVTPVADPLSRVMILAIGVLGVVTFMFCHATVKGGDRGFLFSNLVLLTLAGMNGVVLARDLFTLYVYIEAVVVSSAVLLAFERGPVGLEGAFKYLMLSFLATAMMLAAIGLFVLICGGVGFAEIAASVAAAPRSPLVLIAVTLLLAGLFVKGGLAPFHGWVPDAYAAAPTGAIVLFAGVVTKTTGLYALIRLVTAMDLIRWTPAVQTALLACGAISIAAGALLALVQFDLRRMLAYSSVSQLGYVALGLATGTALGLAGAVLHLSNHAIFSGLLFVDAAAVEQQTGTRDMRRLSGLGSRMPVTSITTMIAMLSGAGVPPLAGFWSKLAVAIALWQVDYRGLAAFAVLCSVISLAYFLVLQRRLFFEEGSEETAAVEEVGMWAAAPAVLLALITVALGIAFPWLFETFLMPVRSFM